MVQPGATAQQFLNPIERRVELIQQEFDSLKKELQGVLVDIRVVLMRATAPFPDADATKPKSTEGMTMQQRNGR